jgi:hypothetical protein
MKDRRVTLEPKFELPSPQAPPRHVASLPPRNSPLVPKTQDRILSPLQSPRTPPRVQPNMIPNSPNTNIRVPLHAQRIAPPIPTPISPTKPLRRSQQIADLGILTAKPLTNNAPAHNTRSQVQHCTITQEAILTCMNTCSYITSRSPTQANAARCSFPIKILKAVLDMNTGELLEMRHLLVNPKYKELWGKSYTT